MYHCTGTSRKGRHQGKRTGRSRKPRPLGRGGFHYTHPIAALIETTQNIEFAGSFLALFAGILLLFLSRNLGTHRRRIGIAAVLILLAFVGTFVQYFLFDYIFSLFSPHLANYTLVLEYDISIQVLSYLYLAIGPYLFGSLILRRLTRLLMILGLAIYTFALLVQSLSFILFAADTTVGQPFNVLGNVLGPAYVYSDWIAPLLFAYAFLHYSLHERRDGPVSQPDQNEEDLSHEPGLIVFER